jgi:hypothetical protein
MQTNMGTISKLIYFIIWLAIPANVLGQTVLCTKLNIKVNVSKNKDAKAVCYNINKGQAILASMGIKLPNRFTVVLSSTLPKNEICSMQCYGFFDVSKNTVYLLDYEGTVKQSRKLPLFVNEVMSPALWGSYIIHELAHVAVNNSNLSGKTLCLVNEYVASVAQMEALTYEERNNIIKSYRGIDGFENTAEISLAYYSINPGMFTIKAYLHYLKLKNGPLFIKQILHEGLSCDNT